MHQEGELDQRGARELVALRTPQPQGDVHRAIPHLARLRGNTAQRGGAVIEFDMDASPGPRLQFLRPGLREVPCEETIRPEELAELQHDGLRLAWPREGEEEAGRQSHQDASHPAIVPRVLTSRQ